LNKYLPLHLLILIELHLIECAPLTLLFVNEKLFARQSIKRTFFPVLSHAAKVSLAIVSKITKFKYSTILKDEKILELLLKFKKIW
jgi:hypothetical protein